jgi:cytochrome c-type biogenesis protein CcmE
MSAIAPNEDRSPDTPEGFERRPSRTPLLLLAVLVLGVFFAVGYTMFTRSVVYYRTPTEALAAPGEHVRVSGTVVPGSIVKDVGGGTVRFDVTDETSTVTVLFEGAAPDTLKDEAEAVAEGTLGPDGLFHADKLFAKCPSKFQAKTPEA